MFYNYLYSILFTFMIGVLVACSQKQSPSTTSVDTAAPDTDTSTSLNSTTTESESSSTTEIASAASIVWPISGTRAQDGPLSSTFGPRLKFSENNRYDFHRGIDIPTPVASQVHAIAAGEVRLAGEYPQYSDKVVQISHNHENSDAVYYSNYIHLSQVLTTEGTMVQPGDVIGLSGVGEGGFPHLHFEIRETGLYQKDCVHPFNILPYPDTNAPQVIIDKVDVAIPGLATVTVSVILPRTEPYADLDFNSIHIEVYDISVAPPVRTGQHSYDIQEWNLNYTPLPPEDASINLDNPDFNHVQVNPNSFTTDSTNYQIQFIFPGLIAPIDPNHTSITATATDIMGNSTQINSNVSD